MPRLWSTQSTLVVVVAVVFLSLFDSSVNLELLLFFLLSMWTRLALFTQTEGRDLLLLLLSTRKTLRPPLTRLNCFCFWCRCDGFDRRAFNCRLWRRSLNWCWCIFVFVGVVQDDLTATIYSTHLLLLFLLLPTSPSTFDALGLMLLLLLFCFCWSVNFINFYVIVAVESLRFVDTDGSL